MSAGLPLASRLQRRTHRLVAQAQDLLVLEAYAAFPDCVLHGGTAIWRCYRGARFSEDVDMYLPTHSEKAARSFREGVAAKGMGELKFKSTGSTIFGKFEYSGTVVRLEAVLRQSPAHVIKSYELLDGALTLVNTLAPEELVLEKVSAYLARRKVRDLYDIFFLLNLVEDRERVTGRVAELLRKYISPVDPEQLRAIVISGAVPTPEAMLEGIARWERRRT